MCIRDRPSLLPKRRQRQSAEFLLDPLYFALEQYAKENTLPHYRECVVCFAQVYDQALPTRRVRDYDNLEEKQILDLLSSFVMADDTGLLCDAYNTAELGEQDCTMIFVMEKHRFPGWLAAVSYTHLDVYKRQYAGCLHADSRHLHHCGHRDSLGGASAHELFPLRPDSR